MPSEYLRNAVREKASRDLAFLDQRQAAYAAADALHEHVHTLVERWPHTAAALAEPSLSGKLKKLRKALEDAEALVAEIHLGLGGETRRAEIAAERRAIVEALSSAGIDEATVNASGGDAQ